MPTLSTPRGTNNFILKRERGRPRPGKAPPWSSNNTCPEHLQEHDRQPTEDFPLLKPISPPAPVKKESSFGNLFTGNQNDFHYLPQMMPTEMHDRRVQSPGAIIGVSPRQDAIHPAKFHRQHGLSCPQSRSAPGPADFQGRPSTILNITFSRPRMFEIRAEGKRMTGRVRVPGNFHPLGVH